MVRVRALVVALALAGMAQAPPASALPLFQQPASSDPSAPSGAGRLSGIVTSTGGPVANATLTLTDSTWHQATTLSDEEGRFAFDGLSEGLFFLAATKDEYLDSSYGGGESPVAGTSTPIALARGQEVTGITLQLARAGVISGTVRDVDGKPAANVDIGITLGPDSGMVGRPTATDSHGVYRIGGLRPGGYQVIASGDVPVFYPGTTQPNRATRVVVSDGQECDGIDFSLVVAPRTRISGVVLRPDGLPPHDVHLSITPPPWVGNWPTLSAAPGPDGRFMFVNVVPGHYMIRASMPPDAGVSAPAGSVNGQVLWAIEDVDVEGSDVAGLALRLQPPTMLSGRVAFDGISLPPPEDLTKAYVRFDKPGFIPTEAVVKLDGTFATQIFPGAYEISAYVRDQPSPGWRLQSAIADGHDLLHGPLDITWGTSDITGVALTFSDRHAQLSGTVKNPAGTPGSDCSIVVFPTDRAFWMPLPTSGRLQTTRPATNGQFTVRDLPPGEYFVATVHDFGANERWKAELLELLVPTSVRITIGDGEQKQLDLASPPPAR